MAIFGVLQFLQGYSQLHVKNRFTENNNGEKIGWMDHNLRVTQFSGRKSRLQRKKIRGKQGNRMQTFYSSFSTVNNLFLLRYYMATWRYEISLQVSSTRERKFRISKRP